MINSLRSGVTGLRSHQTRMDVIGNNIANVNTVGFKRSRVSFHELMGDLKIGVGRLAGGKGGNPAYVGKGVSVGSISQDWNQGSFEYTNIGTDLALVGDGFFVVNDGVRNVLTRAGDLTFDDNGNLVTSSGLNVQGWSIKDDGEIDMSQLRNVQVDLVAQPPTSPKFTENVILSGNLSADAAVGDKIVVSAAIYDEQGTAYNAIIEYTKTATDNQWDYEIRYEGSATPPPFADATGQVDFDVNGALLTPATITLNWDAAYVTSAAPITVDISAMTQYSGSTTASVSDQDGYPSGRFLGYSIAPTGIVTLNYSNGEQKPIFQMALGNVTNPHGLEQLGDNLYGVTSESGVMVLGRPGGEFDTTVVAGALEMSNVDLSAEFTDMIVTQRGYQASARVITTSDELLQEIVQLKR